MLVAGAAASLAVAAPAAALPPLQFDQPCYAEDAPITVTGSGFTAGGVIDLLLGREGKAASVNPFPADAAGNFTKIVNIGSDLGFIEDGATTAEVDIIANDRTRNNDGDEPNFDQDVAIGRITLSRYGVDLRPRVVDGRPRPGRPILVDVVGFAHARTSVLYAHWTRGGKRLKTQRLGLPQGDCGNLRKVVKAFPFARPRAGAYGVYVSTSATKPRGEDWVGVEIRLRARDVPR